MALFEGYERKIDKINGVLAQYGLESVEACREMCVAKGFDPYEIVKGIQPIAFEDAAWAYCVGAAIAIQKGVKNAAEALRLSASACRLSASPAPSLRTARSVWATATWALCCCATRPSASLSWLATNPSLLLKVLSALQALLTRLVRSPCVLS